MDTQHENLQKRVLKIFLITAAIITFIATPIIVMDDLRYELALNLRLAPGRAAEQLADANDGAQLIIVPLEWNQSQVTSPWLFHAQFIAWPTEGGLELENLETGERASIPLSEIGFWSANADGSIVLLRGSMNGDDAAFTVAPASMEIRQLESGEAVPDEPGDWETPSWEKSSGYCNKPSVEQRYVGCFSLADTSSYLAGDYQLDLQMFGDYEHDEPLFRGQGFLPIMGFANHDTVVYLQNERGIWKVMIPDSIRQRAPIGKPYTPPAATPEASPGFDAEATPAA